jgi:hypothetical protein
MMAPVNFAQQLHDGAELGQRQCLRQPSIREHARRVL